MPSVISVVSRSPGVLMPMPSVQPLRANVWLRENQVSSGGQFQPVLLRGLPDFALDLHGRQVCVNGQTRLAGQFLHPPFLKPEDTVTQDPFDQGVLYFAIQSVLTYVGYFGFNVDQILGGKHQGQPHPIVAFANKVAELNAWYSPQGETLTFGRGEIGGVEKWHLASCINAILHELWHLLFDHLQPAFNGGFRSEAGAIHEGGADAFSAFLADDPELSEDYILAIGGDPSPTKGMRTVQNELRLSQVSREVHDRGQVYGGCLWSIKKALEARVGTSTRAAVDLGLQLLLNHGPNYTTARPRPRDFVEALILGAQAMVTSGHAPLPFEILKEIILTNAEARELLTPPSVRRRGPRFFSVGEVLNWARQNGTLDFVRTSRVPYLGGSQERWQQYFLSRQAGPVRVLGRGFFVNQSLGGRTRLAARDVRSLSSEEINPAIRIRAKQALELIRLRLMKERERIEREWERLPLEPMNAGDIQRMRLVSMRRHIVDRSLVELEGIPAGSREGFEEGRVSLVILPNGNSYVYEFTFGEAIFYVDAVTGRVSLQQEVFI